MSRWTVQAEDTRVRVCTPYDDFYMLPDNADVLADQLKAAVKQVREATKRLKQEKIKPGVRVRMVSYASEDPEPVPPIGAEGIVVSIAHPYHAALVAFAGVVGWDGLSASWRVSLECLEVIE